MEKTKEIIIGALVTALAIVYIFSKSKKQETKTV